MELMKKISGTDRPSKARRFSIGFRNLLPDLEIFDWIPGFDFLRRDPQTSVDRRSLTPGFILRLRITFGLMMLTLSILLVSDMLQLLPSRHESSIDAREKLSEGLAIYILDLLDHDNKATAGKILQTLVERHDEILSAAVRDKNGKFIINSERHEEYWQGYLDDSSTPEYVVIPLHRGNQVESRIELRYASLDGEGFAGFVGSPFVQFFGFIVVAGFLVYYFFIGRTLSFLDPSAVIPARVKATLDVLSEGVVLLDQKGLIVLANKAFSKRIGLSSQALLGRKLSNFDWMNLTPYLAAKTVPWSTSLNEGVQHNGVPMNLRTRLSGTHTFSVNCAPIKDSEDKQRGVLVTLDDTTELEKKNVELNAALEKLEESYQKIGAQNKELYRMATRDPLTGCYNRRRFFEKLDHSIGEAKETKQDLACFMCDIDHFKKVNDTYGHAVGDDTIRAMVKVLEDTLEGKGIVGRYGGEEFCIALPGYDINSAAEIAEQCRFNVKYQSYVSISFTSSFGVSSIVSGAEDGAALINLADEALYAAKKGGRNRVVCWQAGEAGGEVSAA